MQSLCKESWADYWALWFIQRPKQRISIQQNWKHWWRVQNNLLSSGHGTYVPSGILFPPVTFWGIHSMWNLRVQCLSTFGFLKVSATQARVIDCATSCEVLRWFLQPAVKSSDDSCSDVNHLRTSQLVAQSARMSCWKGNNVKKQEIKRCRYSFYSWSCFLFY